MKNGLSLCSVILFLLLVPAGRGSAAPGWEHSRYGSPLADSLMYLVSIADDHNNFGGLAGSDTIGSNAGGLLYAAPLMLGADGAAAHQYAGTHRSLELFYSAANPARKDAESAVENLFSKLSKSGHALEYQAAYMFHALLIGGRTRLSYRHNADGSASILIYPAPVVQASEAPYGGKFPAAPVPGSSPQIIEHPCNYCGAGAVMRENGIFADSQLIAGSRTIRGGNTYYDGYWYCDAWEPFAKRVAGAYVYVAPASSPGDTIFGHTNAAFVNKFYPDPQYATSTKKVYARGIFQIRKHAPEWLATSYYQQEVRLDRQNEAYAREHSSNGSASGGMSWTTEPQNQKNDRWNICSCCHGLGYTETYRSDRVYTYQYSSGAQTTTQMFRSVCTCCHGTGL